MRKITQPQSPEKDALKYKFDLLRLRFDLLKLQLVLDLLESRVRSGKADLRRLEQKLIESGIVSESVICGNVRELPPVIKALLEHLGLEWVDAEYRLREKKEEEKE